MIITKTPFRISFVGGGSDLESFYKQSTGAVLSTTINKYMYISSHKFFEEDQLRIKYSKTETVKDINDVQHPIVKEVLKKTDLGKALEISSTADIPAGTGLGSSSAFTVGLLHNLYVRANQYATKEQLATEACEIEIDKLKEPIGKQDQYAAAFGGLNIFKFNPNGTVQIEPLHLKKQTYKDLQQNLLMFYMGSARKAADILKEQSSNMSNQNKIDTVKEMASLVPKLRDALYGEDLLEFGNLLHENWLLKQSLASKIANQEINDLYKKARDAGAIGGKVLGAGGGGFMLLYCEADKQSELREAMSPLKEFSFKFEYEGSKLIYIGDEYEQ
ncbi:GHMP kinase [Candidatus Peregrinibacteria bacterium]|jgi:D-glycero-alpha-D-manno-heptose-7-phosphate kinase|nr:GHMP kinase [Candidatus Peregrinibacteria bacterium]